MTNDEYRRRIAGNSGKEGNRKAVIVPFDEWERLERAREILEHVYLAGIIEARRDSRPAVGLDELMAEEGITRDELED